MKRVMLGFGKDPSPAPLSAAGDATLEALADAEFEAGAGVPLEEAVAWVESWFSPNELPTPKARKLT